VVATHAGQKLSEADLAADGAAVVSALHASGHLDAAVGTPAITKSASGADIELPVDPGAVYTVHAVRWTGQRARPGIDKLPVIAPGDALDNKQLAATASLVEGWLAQRKVHAHVTWDVQVDRAAKLADVVFTVE
jgi:outer membrane protein assembly factor BamA